MASIASPRLLRSRTTRSRGTELAFTATTTPRPRSRTTRSRGTELAFPATAPPPRLRITSWRSTGQGSTVSAARRSSRTTVSSTRTGRTTAALRQARAISGRTRSSSRRRIAGFTSNPALRAWIRGSTAPFRKAGRTWTARPGFRARMWISARMSRTGLHGRSMCRWWCVWAPRVMTLMTGRPGRLRSGRCRQG